MKMGKICGVAACVITIVLGSTSVNATWVSGSGTSCHGEEDEGLVLRYGKYGVQNYDSNDIAKVVCPLALGTQSDYPQEHSDAALTYYDASDDQEFYCEVCQAFSGGTVECSDPRWTASSGNPGGSLDATTSYVGWGTLVWDTTELGSSVYEQWPQGNMTIWCQMPARDLQTGASKILTYWSTVE